MVLAKSSPNKVLDKNFWAIIIFIVFTLACIGLFVYYIFKKEEISTVWCYILYGLLCNFSLFLTIFVNIYKKSHPHIYLDILYYFMILFTSTVLIFGMFLVKYLTSFCAPGQVFSSSLGGCAKQTSPPPTSHGTCPVNQTPYTCYNDSPAGIICHKSCGTDQGFDCTTKTCGCKTDGYINCGNVCCAPSSCNNGSCCPPDLQTNTGCCDIGEVPINGRTACGAKCGPPSSSTGCAKGELCTYIQTTDPSAWPNIKKSIEASAPSPSAYSFDPSTMTAYFCKKLNSCESTPNNTFMPDSQKLEGDNKIYPAWDLTAGSKGGEASVCVSPTPQPSGSYACNSPTPSCKTPCKSMSLVEFAAEPNMNSDTMWKTLNEGSNANYNTQYGYYCNQNDTMNLSRLIASSKMNNCDWTDCVNRLGTIGTDQVYWNPTSEVCSMSQDASGNGGASVQISCTKDIMNPSCEGCSSPADIGKPLTVDCSTCNISEFCDYNSAGILPNCQSPTGQCPQFPPSSLLGCATPASSADDIGQIISGKCDYDPLKTSANALCNTTNGLWSCKAKQECCGTGAFQGAGMTGKISNQGINPTDGSCTQGSQLSCPRGFINGPKNNCELLDPSLNLWDGTNIEGKTIWFRPSPKSDASGNQYHYSDTCYNQTNNDAIVCKDTGPDGPQGTPWKLVQGATNTCPNKGGNNYWLQVGDSDNQLGDATSNGKNFLGDGDSDPGPIHLHPLDKENNPQEFVFNGCSKVDKGVSQNCYLDQAVVQGGIGCASGGKSSIFEIQQICGGNVACPPTLK